MKYFRVIVLILSSIPGVGWSADAVSVEELVDQLSVTLTRSLGTQSFGADEGRVNLQSIQFEYNSAELKSEAIQQVDMLGEAMLMLPDENFHIIGHTDASGKDSYNMSLSERRAETVYEYLVSNYGIEPDRLVSDGKGEERLINEDDPGAAENRRVEVINSVVVEGD